MSDPAQRSAPADWSGWSAADLQVHTRASDGMDGPEQVLEAAVAAGLDCIAITEHDDVGGALRAREIAQERSLSVNVIIGSEVTSRQGHILALWIDEPIPAFRSAAETVEAIWRQGGVAAIAHPAAIMPPSLNAREIDRLVRDLAPSQRANPSLILAIELANPSLLARRRAAPIRTRNAERWRLPETGGSDAHFAAHVGAAVTRYAGRGPDALRAALGSAQTVAEEREQPSLLRVGPRLLLQPARGMTATPRALTRRLTRRLAHRFASDAAARR